MNSPKPSKISATLGIKMPIPLSGESVRSRVRSCEILSIIYWNRHKQGIAVGKILAFRARCRLIKDSRMIAGRAVFHVKQSMNGISLNPGMARRRGPHRACAMGTPDTGGGHLTGRF